MSCLDLDTSQLTTYMLLNYDTSMFLFQSLLGNNFTEEILLEIICDSIIEGTEPLMSLTANIFSPEVNGEAAECFPR